MSLIAQTRLFAHTLRHLTPQQSAYRARRLLRHRLWRWRGTTAPTNLQAQLNGFVPLFAGMQDVGAAGDFKSERETRVAEAQRIAADRFTLLNAEFHFAEPRDWNTTQISHLQRYHLHYFDYLVDLGLLAAVGESDLAYRTFRGLVESWIAGNARLRVDGWHPYTISVRTVNWLQAACDFAEPLQADPEFRRKFLGSLYAQCRFLASDLEFDVRGNHLVKNLRALIFAGVAFSGAEPQKWLATGLRVLEAEVAEQVLPDGGHFERVPGYHACVLRDLLEIAICLRRNGRSSPAWLDAAIRRMVTWLRQVLRPDGAYPLLKDTAIDAAPPPADLFATAAQYFGEADMKPNARTGLYPCLVFGKSIASKCATSPTTEAASCLLPDSGYAVLKDVSRGDHLIFDIGRPCPDYLPGHAHADLLSFELTVGNQPIFVDSGVYEYTRGPWRDYFRSTRAHNTVEVAGENQSEVWSSFRVAQRARPSKPRWSDDGGAVIVQCSHDGYRRLSTPVVHRRTLARQRGAFWIIVDEVLGSGRTRAVSHWHLHPELQFEAAGDDAWQIDGSSEALALAAFGQTDSEQTRGCLESTRQGWYSEQFGQLQANSVLSLTCEGTLPLTWGVVIAEQSAATIERFERTPAGVEIEFSHARTTYRLFVPEVGTPRLQKQSHQPLISNREFCGTPIP
ncbi:MAG TPA: alginate lyase family protein [Planctomycetaceae bacterium]|nr:alginate lyase family protein [Planctomycetaceae bacterium]